MPATWIWKRFHKRLATIDSRKDTLSKSLADGLFLHRILSLFFFCLQERIDPGQRFLRQDQAGCDNGLAASNHAITSTLLVFGPIGVKKVLFHVADQSHREVGIFKDRSLELLRILFNERERRVELG